LDFLVSQNYCPPSNLVLLFQVRSLAPSYYYVFSFSFSGGLEIEGEGQTMPLPLRNRKTLRLGENQLARNLALAIGYG